MPSIQIYLHHFPSIDDNIRNRKNVISSTKKGITLQHNFKATTNSDLLFILGCPGTGKTFLYEHILQLNRSQQIVFAAPTGAVASRLPKGRKSAFDLAKQTPRIRVSQIANVLQWFLSLVPRLSGVANCKKLYYF